MKTGMIIFLCFNAIIGINSISHGNADRLISLPKCQFDTKRDWAKYPALIEINDPSRTLYAVGDIHGSFAEFYSLLEKAKLIKGHIPAVPQNFEWLGGNSILVTTGDAINKGTNTNDVVHFLIQLQMKAEQAGGKLIHVYGNHEMGLLIDENNKNQSFKNGNPIYGPSGEKYQVLAEELKSKSIDPCSFISPASKTGAWLRNLPTAALVNGIYLSHSGWTNRMSRDEINDNFKKMVNTNDWGNPFVCGSEAKPIGGLLNSDAWWQQDPDELSANLKSVGARQILFGHDPKVFNQKGHILAYELGPIGSGQLLIKLDVGLVSQNSRGEMIRCRAKNWLRDGGCKLFEILSRGKGSEKLSFSEISSNSDEASQCKGIQNTHGEFVVLPICRKPPQQEAKARTSC